MPRIPVPWRLCLRLSVALFLLSPQTGVGQIPAIDLNTPQAAAATPAFPDPLKLVDGW